MSGFRIPDHITWKNLKSGVVLLNLNSSDYFTLNEVASLIWRDLVEGAPRERTVERIFDEYDCDEEQARADLEVQLGFFLEEGLLESGPPNGEG